MAWVVETLRTSPTDPSRLPCVVCGKTPTFSWWCLNDPNDLGAHKHVPVCAAHDSDQYLEYILLAELTGAVETLKR